MALTPKQARFAEEYLVDLNAAAAARRAGYSPRTADRTGHDLLRKPEIAAAIEGGRKAQSERAGLDAERVLREFAAVALADVGDVLDFTGEHVRLRPAKDIPESARRAIASIKVKRYFEGHGDDAKEVEVIEYRFWPKLDALREVAARVEPPRPKEPLRVDVTTGGEPLDRNSLTAEDLAAAAALVGVAGLRVPQDG